MNGVHDMGGMDGMGPIRREQDEPVFHAPWEARVFALRQAAGAWRKWNIDAGRYEIERIPAADYLRMSYYERWLASLAALLVKRGLVTPAEMERGRPAPGSTKATPPLTADNVRPTLSRRAPRRDTPVAPRFTVGERVRARNIHPTGHTRLPRYARGKLGTIVRDHGVYVFPDTNAQFLDENPQHVYSVRFSARELWGERAAPRDAVYIDMWDGYLERA
jgi:nitrile hydratase subunit beta